MWKSHELHLVTGDHIIGNLMFHHNIKMSAKHKKITKYLCFSGKIFANYLNIFL